MPPGGGGDQEFEERNHPPATGHECRDDEASSRSPPTPSLPDLAVTPVASENKDGHQREEEPPAIFPEDVLIEILSRVPYMSLCRFKCVSTEWLALCSDSDIHKRSPQAMSGFFYKDHSWRFHNLSGKGPPMVDPDLPFLRSSYQHFSVTQCSTSLLLCKC